MKIKEPNSLLCEQYDKHRIDIRIFAVTFIVGLLIHSYMITNKFFNYFEMGNILSDMNYTQNDTLGLGRWFLPIASNLFTSFSVPAVNGVITLCYMSISALLITKLLRMTGIVYRMLFGIIWIAFPGMASVFAFGVNSDALGLSVLLAVLSAYSTVFWKRGILAGSLFLCFSIGIYQPYMSVTIGLFYCVLLIDILQKKLEIKKYLWKAGRFLVVLAAGFLLYYVILQVCVNLAGTQISGYHGVNEMTSFTPKGIVKGLVYSYGYFLTYLFSLNYTYSMGMVIANVLGAVVLLVSLWRLAASYPGMQKMGILLMTTLLPLGMESAPFLMGDRVGNGVDRYMMFSTMLIWALFFKCAELDDGFKTVNHNKIRTRQWIGITAAVVTIMTGYVICNESYHRMEALTEATTGYLNRVAARIELLPEWQEGKSIYFVNPRNLLNDYYEVQIPKYERLKNMPGTEFAPSYSEKAIINYLEVYLHFPVEPATQKQKDALDKNDIVQSMPAFPAQDSVRVVDDVIVVKISETRR